MTAEKDLSQASGPTNQLDLTSHLTEFPAAT